MAKQATLMRRPTVLNHSIQLEFPGACTIKHYDQVMYRKWTDFLVS
jgi:hypothetical protein